MNRLIRLMATTLLTFALVAAVGASRAAPVRAADPVTFGTPSVTSTYGESIVFEQPVELSSPSSRVEILLRTQGSDGPGVFESPPLGRGPATLIYTRDLADGHIVPNTTFTAQFRITDEDGEQWVGPEITGTYSDSSVDWDTLQGDVVRVHWYEGGEAFGQRALQIGDEAVAEVSELLGVTEEEPIDFFIYADQDAFYAALGPSTRENVGGEAHADIRTMFALITPSEINDDWVEVVVPHELTHLVFDTATKNPYHAPPHWLNEGVAVYLSEGYTSDDRAMVENAAQSGTIIPLEGLVGAFPTTRDRFFLAYAESVSAVDDIVADHGQDALVGLIRSYADGVSDDEAFTAALGMDMAAFEQSWLEGLGASVPVQHGPQAAPGGPLPEGWSAAAPNATSQPGATPRATSGTNAPIDEPSSAGVNPLLLAGLGLLLVGVIAIGAVTWRRSRQPAATVPAFAAAPAPTDTPPPAEAEAEAFRLPAPPPDDDERPPS